MVEGCQQGTSASRRWRTYLGGSVVFSRCDCLDLQLQRGAIGTTKQRDSSLGQRKLPGAIRVMLWAFWAGSANIHFLFSSIMQLIYDFVWLEILNLVYFVSETVGSPTDLQFTNQKCVPSSVSDSYNALQILITNQATMMVLALSHPIFSLFSLQFWHLV